MVSKVALVLLLGIVGIVSSSRCPSRRVVSPCSCGDDGEDLQVFCHDEDMTLDEIKKILGAFNTNYAIDLDFYYLNLGTIPTDFFEGFNISVLSFAHCKFEQIPDEQGRVLVGLEDTLQRLVVLATIEKHNSPVVLDLSHLNKLTDLYITSNTIPELSDNWFKKGPTSLSHLYISYNDIEKLGSHAFANLPNLKTLLLDSNDFGGVNRSMLPNPATHLEELQLNENHLDTLPEDFFTEMPALKFLQLEDNHLTHLPQETFEKIWGQLDYIDLHGNKIDCEDSSLRWIANSNSTVKITGRCATPESRHGSRIESIIKQIRKRNY